MQTLVLADHQVYVGIRDPKLEHTKFRECVENYIIRKLLKFGDAAIQGVADKIAEILAIPKGMRPLRDTVDYSD